MDNSPNSLLKLFNVFTYPQTYLNLVYLFLAFPLGLTYFIILITGISLGIGLLILWVGFLILVAVLALSWAFTIFERQLAINLLRIHIPQKPSMSVPGETVLHQLKRLATNSQTWKGMLYLFLKFPLGTITFTVAVTLLAVSFSLILAPVIYQFVPINFFYVQVNNFSLALLMMVIGIFALPLSLHALNYVAELWGKVSEIFLGERIEISTPTSAPVTTADGG
jgi:hypothetical protein